MNWREFWEGLKSGIVNMAVRGAVIFGAAMAYGGGIFAPVIAIGLAAGVILNVYSGVKRSQKHERSLLDQFRPEIAAELGISPELATTKDLQKVAKTNPVIRQSLNEDTARLLTGWTALVFAAATTLLVGSLVPLPFLENSPTFFEWLSGKGMTIGTEGAGIKIGGTLLASLAMGGVKQAFGYVARGMFGGNQKTIAERIEALEVQLGQGHALAPEQVMEVAVAANPELGRNIKKAWGKSYGEMSPEEQCNVLAHYPATEQVVRLTESVNRGNVAPAEIAYAVMGRESGVAWDYNPAGPKVREKALDLGGFASDLPDILTDGPSLEHLGTLSKTARDIGTHYGRRTQAAPAYHPAQNQRGSFVAALEAERNQAPAVAAGRA